MMQRMVPVVLRTALALMIVAMAAVTAFGQTKLVFLNPHVDDPYVTARQKAIERFEAAHPGVEVEMITPSTAYFDRMLALIASGNPPDIVWFRPVRSSASKSPG